MLITKAPKGVMEVLPQDSYRWHSIEDTMREVCRLYGFREIRVPVFEHTELFLRGVGATTDIVQKEMYTFEDKGGRSLTLKPEGTAGVARTFVERGLTNLPMPVKMYYLYSPMFRYEQPQAGRLREHHQFGVEVFGSAAPTIDAEVILLALSVIEKLGVHGLEVHLNSIGCPCCRPAYMDKLREYFSAFKNILCETCKGRLERNPLRIFDCKGKACQQVVTEAPNVMDFLCEDCRTHFSALCGLLDHLGVKYEVDPLLVRGLDYYTRTVFEIIAPAIGAKSAVCAGGRYDKLIQEISGADIPGIGFGMGMERLLLALQSYGDKSIAEPPLADVYVAPLGAVCREVGFALVRNLREAGISTETDHMERSLRAQMKYADKIGCRFTAVIGENELMKGVTKVRNMADGTENEVEITNAVAWIKAQLKV